MAYKRVLSIELGVQTTRICEMDFRSKKPSVYNCCSFETPDGSVEDGFIRNREILSVAMKEAMNKCGMKTNSVVFSVASSKIANREVNMPVVAENKIKGLITTNAKEYFPVNIDEYIITHRLLEKVVNEEEKSLRVLVLAAPSTLIESYYDFARMMNFEIMAIDYVGNSCFETVKRQTGEGVNIVIQLNEQNTLINILDDETLALQRTVPYGMNAMIEAALNCGEFDIDDRQSAIEKLYSETLINSKLNESVIDDVALAYMENNDDSYATQLKQMKAKDEITDTFNYLISNIVRVLDYYSAKNPDKKVAALHLSGVGSRIKGISHLFKNEIFIDIDKFENILGVNFERSCMIQDNMKSDYAVSVGAAIEPVDFIPKEHLAVARKKSVAKGSALLFTGCLILAGLLVVGSLLVNTTCKQKKKKLEREVASFSKIEELVNGCNEASLKKTNAENAFAASLNINYLYNVLLDELQSSLPANVSVTNLTVNETGINITLKGHSIQEVGETLIQLKKCALIDSVSIGTVAGTTDDAGAQSYDFSVSCTAVVLDYNKFVEGEATELFVRSLVYGDENKDESAKTDANEDKDETSEDKTSSEDTTAEDTTSEDTTTDDATADDTSANSEQE